MSQSGWHPFYLVDGETQSVHLVYMTPSVKNKVYLKAVGVWDTNKINKSCFNIELKSLLSYTNLLNQQTYIKA